MGLEEIGSSIKKTLRSLCLSYGWSYGVFWRFDPRNHMLLTMEDAYYEEYVGSVVNSMLLQVHMLGEGKIGEAALDKKHRWMFLDAKGPVSSWDASELDLQISSGIKTVAVIPVESLGVVQFGSIKEVSETTEFVDQARKSLLDKANFVGVAQAGSASSSLISDPTGSNGLFSSTIPSQNSFYGDLFTSWTNIFENVTSFSTFDSISFPGETIAAKSSDHCSNLEIFDPNFGSLIKDSIYDDRPSILLDTLQEQLEPAQVPASVFDPCQLDDLSQLLTGSSNLHVHGLDAMVCNDVLQTLGVDGISSVFGGSDMFPGIQCKQSVSSSQSSLSNALNSCGKVESFDAASNNDFGMVFGFGKSDNCIATPRKGLFSELGLEHLLRDVSSCSSITKSCIDDQWPTSKKRKTDNYETISNKLPLTGHPLGVKLMAPSSSGGLQECMPKSQPELWFDDSYSMDAKSCISGVNSQTKKPEEPTKATKKRARPGESTRPRPKDRQLIADRIKELRDLIPNGAKLSIDALLSRTIKHMIFMQSLSKHADKLKQAEEPKLTGHDNNGMARRGESGSRGATWAYEVGGTNLFCPIIVEDLSHPGQMLIEMLCEERGYFLEIADVVRGFGLTILKGLMESRNDKIWAHFIVEGNGHVTRMDVFVSLMQLLQGTTSSGVNTSIEPAKVVDNGAPLWSNYQQHVVPLPIS